MRPKSVAGICVIVSFLWVVAAIFACGSNEPPNAVLTADAKYVPENTEIEFDGSGSTDDWRIVEYEWDFTDSGWVTGNSKETYSYSTDGEKTAKLKVTDDSNDYDIAEFTVYVSDQMEVKYVKTGGTSDGSSWSDPNGDIKAMVDSFAANQCGQVWVAEGTYTPGTNRSDSFVMREGVDIYGGFAGDESTLAERDWAAHPARLSGEIGSAGNDDNCYHVAEANDWSALDSLYIQDGNADGSGGTGTNMGAGIYSYSVSPTIRNCVIKDNHAADFGGGILVSYAAPTITNCLFSDNTSDSSGGAIFVGYFSCPVITNCVMVGNTAHSGAGINVLNYSDPVIVNCTLTGNEATYLSAGIKVDNGSEPTITNCILWGNSVNGTQNETAQIHIYGNRPLVKYCCIQDDDPGEGSIPFGGGNPNYNIDDRPWFVDSNTPEGPDGAFVTVDDGLRLRINSKCIDAGYGNTARATDILGLERVDINNVDNTGGGEPNYTDIGAYEALGLLTVNFLNEPTGAQCTLIHNNEYYDGIWHGDGYQVELSPGTYIVRLKPTYSSSSGLWHTADDVTVDVAVNASETVTVWYWYPAVWVSDTRGDNSGDGGYDDPYKTIQYGIDNAQNVTGNVYRVLVEYGTYYEHLIFPDRRTDDRAIKLKGLNSGGMPNGDKPIVDAGSGEHRSYSVFKLYYVSGDGTLVDNFLIREGYASRGSAIGGGMYIRSSSATTITNCEFYSNEANNGGGLFIEACSPSIQNCVFKSNKAWTKGGAIYTTLCQSVISECDIGYSSANRAPNSSSSSAEIYAFTEYVPTYKCCEIRGGLPGPYCDDSGTTPNTQGCD